VARVLVVEDEESFSDALSYMLRKEGFEVAVAPTGTHALTEFDRNGADIVLLDLMLPEMSGTEVCRQLRQKSAVPIIMVTARDSEIDKVVGLEIGADDYITKPYSPRELVARVRAVLRRTGPGAPGAAAAGTSAGDPGLAFEGWVLDVPKRELRSAAGACCDLTTSEFDLLKAFATHANRVLSRDQIMDLLRGHDWSPTDRSIDNLVMRLRRKLEPDVERPRLIKSVRGVGYCFAANVSSAG
jgi:two-component system, OmpR family, response regulator RegX3